jgi:hypothetical protein
MWVFPCIFILAKESAFLGFGSCASREEKQKSVKKPSIVCFKKKYFILLIL